MKAKLITTFSIILISLFFTGFQVFAAENNESEDNDEGNISEQDDVQKVCSSTDDPEDSEIESVNDEAVDEDQCSENDLVSAEEDQDDDGDSDKESNMICHKDEDTKNPSSSDSDKVDSDKNEDQSKSNQDDDGNQDAHQEEDYSEDPSAVNEDQEDCNTDEDKESSQEENSSEDSSETDNDSDIGDGDIDNDQPESDDEEDEDSDEQQEDSTDETTDPEETDDEDNQQEVDESTESEDDNEDKVTEENQVDSDKDAEENDEDQVDSKSDKKDTQKAKKKNTVKETKAKSGPPYKLGDRDNAIKDIKKKLNKIGFSGITETTYFGDYTEKKVKQFQENYGLKVNGVVNANTLKKLNEVYDSPYQLGKRNSQVTAFKKKMNKTQFSGISVTNYYGDYTENRVKEFQRFAGLKANGIADSKTRSELDKYLSGYKKGNSSKAIANFKKKLNKVGFSGITVTNYFGDYTKKKVKEFQENYGLNANGVANVKTLKKLDEVYGSSYQLGKRNTQVTAFKKKMNKTQFSGISVTNYYGDYTENRVKEFQRFAGLKANGIADSKTRSELDKYLSGYKKGSSSKAIANFKKKLNKVGFSGITVTNYFGDYTKKKVKEFQKNYGLNANGVANVKTLKKLDEVYNSPYQLGKRNNQVIAFKKKMNKTQFSGISVTNFYGKYTVKRVKEFQRFVGLKANGIADSKTRSELDKYLSGYKKGNSSKAIANFKKKLNNIGFGGITVTNYFGDYTVKQVKQFQKYYGLQADGAVGPSTMKKINTVYNSPFQKGKSHKKTAEIKKKLNDLGYSGITVTNYFGDYTKKQVQKFQRDYGLRVNGIADEVTRKKIDEIWDASDSVKETSYGLTLKQALNMQMKANPQSDKNYAYVSKEYIKNGRVTASALNVRVGPSAAYNAIGQLLEGAKVTVQSEVNGWYAISYSYSGWVSATPKDTEYYLNPNNFKNDDKQKFQFLDLSVTSGATKAVLNDYLSGKGTLAKQGQAFIDAGNKHGVNDVYLISHAIHETGNGSSTLASGIPVDKNGKITRDSNGNIAKTKQTVATVYNMYGIGAVDSCPIECGAKRAFEEGWTTPYKAIVGGASFIGNGYIDKGQNTLYKMRWNPAQMDKGNVTHQYATDVGWASKQVTTLYNLYQKLSFYKLSLDIPKYK